MSNKAGSLYVVSTPIGNLGDLSARAQEVLKQVDLIAAEDTRHSKHLLSHFGIPGQLVSCHEHNEAQQAESFVRRLQGGESIALLSDAGTPLVSDPGYRVVNAAIDAGIRVIPIPGPCAAITALSVAGLPTDRFRFIGFLPARSEARRSVLGQLAGDPDTLVLYESPRRLAAMLADAAEIVGPERPAVLARELTKLHENVIRGTMSELAKRAPSEPDWKKGELVVVIGGYPGQAASELAIEVERVLQALLEELPLKQAVALAARITGERKNRVYDLAIRLRS